MIGEYEIIAEIDYTKANGDYVIRRVSVVYEYEASEPDGHYEDGRLMEYRTEEKMRITGVYCYDHEITKFIERLANAKDIMTGLYADCYHDRNHKGLRGAVPMKK